MSDCSHTLHFSSLNITSLLKNQIFTGRKLSKKVKIWTSKIDDYPWWKLLCKCCHTVFKCFYTFRVQTLNGSLLRLLLNRLHWANLKACPIDLHPLLKLKKMKWTTMVIASQFSSQMIHVHVTFMVEAALWNLFWELNNCCTLPNMTNLVNAQWWAGIW